MTPSTSRRPSWPFLRSYLSHNPPWFPIMGIAVLFHGGRETVPKELRLHILFMRRTLLITGISGLILLSALLVIPPLLAAELSSERAREEILAHLKRSGHAPPHG